MSIPIAPHSWHRNREGLGIWEGRGKVVATGVGTSPTARRWDEKPETSLGALTIIAIRKAIEDAGISPDEIDGIVLTPESTTGRFERSECARPGRLGRRLQDGRLPAGRHHSRRHRLATPEHAGVDERPVQDERTGLYVGRVHDGGRSREPGPTGTCLVVRGWHNLAGRYYVGQGAAARETASRARRSTAGSGACRRARPPP